MTVSLLDEFLGLIEELQSMLPRFIEHRAELAAEVERCHEDIDDYRANRRAALDALAEWDESWPAEATAKRNAAIEALWITVRA